MRTVRRDPKYHIGLMRFMTEHCPPSLEGEFHADAYGCSAVIYKPLGRKRKWYEFFDRREVVATVHHERIILNCPEYYADFEDLIREYEHHTGKEVTLEYWESSQKETV